MRITVYAEQEILMNLKSLSLVLVIAIAFATLPIQAQTIPAFHAKALDDSDVVVPNQGSQQILIIVIGFSKKAGEVCQPWGKHLSADYLQDSHATYYQIAHLEGAPSFVRPMILRGMRKSLPPQEQAHFVPLYDNQAAWKKTVQFSDLDTAYIIVVQPQGKIAWQFHGTYSDPEYANLKRVVSDLAQKSAHTDSPAIIAK
jgi:hypothetical protein